MKRAAERHFGMALGRMNIPSAEIRDFAAIVHFSGAELPMDSWLGEKKYAASHEKKKYPVLHCGSIMDPQVCRAIVTAPEKHRREFACECGALCEKLWQNGVNTVSLDFGMEEILTDPAAEDAVRGILLLLAPVLYRTKQTLLLPYRVPSRFSPSEMNRFLRRTLIGQVKLRLDVHPYELEEPERVITQTADLLVFEVRSVTFIYDADSGCRIRKEHLEPWLRRLERRGFCGPYLLAPISRRQMALPEAGAWDKIAEIFLNE